MLRRRIASPDEYDGNYCRNDARDEESHATMKASCTASAGRVSLVSLMLAQATESDLKCEVDEGTIEFQAQAPKVGLAWPIKVRMACETKEGQWQQQDSITSVLKYRDTTQKQ